MKRWLLLSLACAACVRAPTQAEVLVGRKTPSGAPPGFPAHCARKGKVAFVGVLPLTTLEVTAVAERYRRHFGLDAAVLPSLPIAPEAYDRDRNQHDADRVLQGLPSAPDTWVIGITDTDLFTSQRDWRFCFNLRGERGVIVSTARTEPERGLLSADRTMKLITRMLAETYCGLTRGGPDDSVLRPTMMGLGDLDQIDESVWIPAPLTY